MFLQTRTIRGRGRLRGISAVPLRFTSVLTERAMDALAQAEEQNPEATAVREAVTAGTSEVFTDTPADTDPQAAACDCLISQGMQPALTAQGVTLTTEMGRVLFAECMSDEAAFKAQMDEHGIAYEACKPWYARKVTKYVGGGVLLAGLAWMVLR
jgi:hypothetical protein